MAAFVSGSRRRGPVGVVKPAEQAPSAATQVKVALTPPKTFTDEEKAVWMELSPLAIEVGTLTAASAMAFADLCTFITMERRYRSAPLAIGGPDHRGMIKQVETLRARFRLVPDGKPVQAQPKEIDPFAEFEAAG